MNQGGNPLNVGTGYQQPVSLVNPPADADARFDADEGPCENSPTHIFNLTASAETPQFDNTALRVIASGWRVSGIFRAQSGRAFSIQTGILALSGVQGTAQRANQVLDGSVRGQDSQPVVQPGGVRAAGARARRNIRTQRLRRHGHARRRSRARAVVRVRRHAPHRGARRDLQRIQLVQAGTPGEHGGHPVSGGRRSATPTSDGISPRTIRASCSSR